MIQIPAFLKPDYDPHNAARLEPKPIEPRELKTLDDVQHWLRQAE